MSNTQSTFHLTGLHCPSCQKITEKRIGKIAGVTRAETSIETGQVLIEADRKISKEEIAQVLIGTDYRIN